MVRRGDGSFTRALRTAADLGGEDVPVPPAPITVLLTGILGTLLGKRPFYGVLSPLSPARGLLPPHPGREAGD